MTTVMFPSKNLRFISGSRESKDVYIYHVIMQSKIEFTAEV